MSGNSNTAGCTLIKIFTYIQHTVIYVFVAKSTSMRRYLSVTAIAFFMLFLADIVMFAALAQTYSYRHYTTNDIINPLPGSSSFSIIQDHEGFIWFSIIGSGVVRYDGNALEVINNDEGELNNVVALRQTSDNRLWALSGAGLFVSEDPLYHVKTSGLPVFTNMLQSAQGEIHLYSGRSLAYGNRATAEDPETGGIWVATGTAGVVHYGKDNSGFWRADSLLPASANPEFGDEINDVYSVVIRKNGELVYVSRGGYIGVLSRDERMNFLETGTYPQGGFKRFENAAQYGVHICLFEDSDQQLWGGTTLGVAWRIDGEAHSRIHSDDIPFLPDDTRTVPNAMIFEIGQGSGKNIWVAHSAGAGVFDPEKNYPVKNVTGTGGSGINSMFTDYEGNIWLAGYDGLLKFRPDFDVFTLLENESAPFSLNNQIRGVTYDPAVPGRVLMGTSKGIVSATEVNGSYEFDLIDKSVTGMENAVYALSTDQSNNIWAGKNNGFTIISESARQPFRNRRSDFSGRTPDGRYVYSYSGDYSITGIDHSTVNGREVTFLYSESYVFSVYENELYTMGRPTDQHGLGITKIQVGPDSHIWIASNYGALIRSTLPFPDLIHDDGFELIFRQPVERRIFQEYFNPVVLNGEPVSGTISNPIFSQNELFITTSSGMQVLEREPDDDSGFQWITRKTITTENGLLRNNPSAVVADFDRGVFWVGGQAGLNAIDMNSYEILLSKNRKQGMAEEFLMSRNSLMLYEGDVYYGIAKGLIRYQPDMEGSRKVTYPRINITDHLIEQSRWGNSFVELRFTAPSFIDETDVGFRYRLRGFDSDWIDAGKNNITRYTNLPAWFFPKKYEFEVTAVNGNGTASRHPAVMEFVINPPVYRRWWFLLLMVSALMMGGYFTVQNRVNSFRQKQEQIALQRQFELTQRIGAAVAHDMKNSVFSLTFLGRNLEKRFENQEFRNDAIETIKNTTEHLNALIQKFQEQRSEWHITLNKSDISGTIASVVKRNRINLNPGIKINFESRPDIEWMHDSGAVDRIMDNLIRNAIESISGDGEIEITLDRDEKTQKTIIQVGDTGSGMPDEFIRNHLFKPFSTTKKQGIGLGLYAVKELAEAHSGSLKVKSIIDQGTTFILEFESSKNNPA